MKRLLLALALLCIPAAASAQCNGVFPNQTVCGNITGAGNLPRPTSPSSFLGAAGGTNGQTQYNNSGSLGGYTPSGDVTVNPSTGVETIQPGVVSNTKLATGAANTYKGSLNGSTTSDITLSACTAVYQVTQYILGTGWQCANTAVIPSRATAITLNLSAFSAVRTLGYYTAGDGGGATYKNIASATPSDAQVLTGHISAGGSGYTNGSYTGISFIASNSSNLIASMTVSGGAVTVVTLNSPTTSAGNKVGDVLSVAACSTSSAGCIGTGSGFTWTVDTVSSPKGSFTDSASNNWQIVVDDGNSANIRQFGAKCNWTGTDGSATDDTASIQAASNWLAIINSPGADAGGGLGSRLFLPKGTCMTSSLIIVPYGVQWWGQGRQATFIHPNSTFSVASNVVDICDPSTHLACFDASINHMGFYSTLVNGNSSTAIVYSNNIQHMFALDDVKIYGGNRVAAYFEVGYGGASWVGFHSVETNNSGGCGGASTSNPQWILNYGTANIHLTDIVTTGPGVCASPNVGVNINGGIYDIENYHAEGVLTAGLDIASGAGSLVRAHQLTGGNGTVGVVALHVGNPNGTVVIGLATPNGSTNTVTNGHSGGSNVTTAILTDTTFSP